MQSDQELLKKAMANNPAMAKVLWKRIAAGGVASEVIVEWTQHVAKRLVDEALDHKPENRRADRAWRALGVSGARAIDDAALVLRRDVQFLTSGRPIGNLEVVRILQLGMDIPEAETPSGLRRFAKRIDRIRKKRQ